MTTQGIVLLDRPFVSPFLIDTIREHALPVVETGAAGEWGLDDGAILIDEAHAVHLARSHDDLAIYTNSENAIGWISEHLSFTDLPEKIDLFKNKAKFRELIRSLYPDFYFREHTLRNKSRGNLRKEGCKGIASMERAIEER